MKYKLIKIIPFNRNIENTNPGINSILSEDVWVDTYHLDPGAYPDWFEGVKEPQFKAGDWIVFTDLEDKYEKHNGDVVRIISCKEDSHHSYWVNHTPDSFTGGGFGYKPYKDNVRLATPQEIETHLIAEAKKRGYTEGTRYIDDRWKDKQTWKSYKTAEYRPEDDKLIDGHGGAIYRNGKWAEIVKEEEIKIGEYEVKFRDREISIGCKKYTFAEVKELYNICLTFGVSQIYAHNHLVEYITLKRIFDKIVR